jgi:hypothetical protein
VISTANYRCSFCHGTEWVGFKISFEHIYFFSDEMLFRIVQSMGFDLLSWYSIGDGLMPKVNTDKSLITKIKPAIKKLPLVSLAWNGLKNLFSRCSKDTPYDVHGQGHIFVALFQKKGKAIET